MKSDVLLRAMVILAVLGFGVFIAHARPRPDVTHRLGFESSLWLERRGDLIVQVGLLLVGAFGIRALLPSSDEEKNNDDVD